MDECKEMCTRRSGCVLRICMTVYVYVYNDEMKMAPETLCILNLWRFIGISSPISRTRILMVSRTIAKAFCSVTGGHGKE